MENISVTGEFGRKPALSFDGTPSDELVGGSAIEGEGGLAAKFAGDRNVLHGFFLVGVSVE